MTDDLQDFIPFEEASVEITMMNSFTAPWLRSFSSSTPTAPQTSAGSKFITLHNEILAFCDFISPTAGEIAQRKALVSEMESIVHEVYPMASVHIFGSQLTTILTPTSDLDLAVLDVPCGEHEALYKIEEVIKKRGIVSYLEVIANAKVPIIKLDHIFSGISVDICVNNDSGLRTGLIMRRFVREFPPLKPLTMLLKVFLGQRKLHETYTGGLGSFALSTMIVSFFQQRQRLANFRNLQAQTWNLGSLLHDFFYLYGVLFNYSEVGISILNGGEYFRKDDRSWCQPHGRAQIISIENPDDPSVDMGRNSFMFSKIKRAFEHAHQVLTATLSNPEYEESYLAYIIRSDNAILTSRVPILLAEKVKPESEMTNMKSETRGKELKQKRKKLGKEDDKEVNVGDDKSIIHMDDSDRSDSHKKRRFHVAQKDSLGDIAKSAQDSSGRAVGNHRDTVKETLTNTKAASSSSRIVVRN